MATRKGLRFEELTAEQKMKALALLKTGTSAKGYEQATTIMSLENVLKDMEKKGTMVRNPNWYFVSIFGKPSKTGKWGWRIEGHHLSVNFTLDRGQIESPTPFMFGSNPADVKSGPREGLRSYSGSRGSRSRPDRFPRRRREEAGPSSEGFPRDRGEYACRQARRSGRHPGREAQRETTAIC